MSFMCSQVELLHLNNSSFSLPSLQLIENCVCLLRNLSYQVHREIPGFERYQEAITVNQGPASSGQKGGCFSSRKSKGLCPGQREIHAVLVELVSGGMSLLTSPPHKTDTNTHAHKIPRCHRDINNPPSLQGKLILSPVTLFVFH